jgi:hypothetical protein
MKSIPTTRKIFGLDRTLEVVLFGYLKEGKPKKQKITNSAASRDKINHYF